MPHLVHLLALGAVLLRPHIQELRSGLGRLLDHGRQGQIAIHGGADDVVELEGRFSSREP